MRWRPVSDRIRTLLLEANGTHWAAVCIDTLGNGIFTSRRVGQWRHRHRALRKLFGDRYADASYMSDWRDAFFAESRLAVETCNITNLIEFTRNRRKIREFDLIVILHSAAGDRMSLLTAAAGWFQGRRGKLAMFIGNEYDLLEEKIAFARRAGADYLCTQLPLEAARSLYRDVPSAIVPMPHGLNPAMYAPKAVDRSIDVGFVGDLYERLIGDRERTDIVCFFRDHGQAYGLRCEIRSERMPREVWSAFLSSCKAVIGAESGTYFLQRDGAALKCAKRVIRSRPEASFDDVRRECFDGNQERINGKAVSSRHFEPIGTKTCQLLIEGAYNGILEPDQHYIAVKRDLSNIDDAIRRLKDDNYRTTIAENAYQHVMTAHTYAHRVAHLVDVVESGSGEPLRHISETANLAPRTSAASEPPTFARMNGAVATVCTRERSSAVALAAAEACGGVRGALAPR
jgi:hypothetical protein